MNRPTIRQHRQFGNRALFCRSNFWNPAVAAVLLLAPLARGAEPTTDETSSQTRVEGAHDNSDSATTKPAAVQGQLSHGGSDDLTNLSLEDLMDVQVTSVSKKKQSISEAPAAVSVISQDDITRSGFSTIPDLLRLAPGLDVARLNASSWAVGVRGLNDQFTNNLLVLQDGRTLYSPLFAGVVWDTVDYVLEDLDRIEVIRGPGATLWGANAVNGVINITSKDSRDTQGWLLSTRGSNDDSDLSLRYGGRLSDDTTYRVYLKTTYFNELDSPTGNNAGDDWYSMRGGFRIDKHASDKDTFTLQGDVADNQMQFPSNIPALTAPFSQFRNTGRYDMTGNLLTRWDHRDGDDSDFSLQLYYDYLGVNSFSTNYNQNTIDIDFHHRFQLGKRNEVTWGLGYRIVSSHDGTTPFVSSNPATRNLSLYSAFLQDTLTLKPDRLFFTLGSKFERNDFTGLEVQPSARLLWTPNKQNSVWGAVSRAMRTPSLLSDQRVVEGATGIPVAPGVVAPAEVVVFGNPREKSEQLVAYELGYRFQPTKTFSVDTSLFYNNYDRVQTVENGTPIIGAPVIIPVNIANNGTGDTYGGEISAILRVTERWQLSASYSMLEASFHTLDATGTQLSQDTSAPENQAQIHSYFSIAKNLQLNAAVFYVGGVNEFNIPGYVSTDVNIAWQPKEAMNVTVGVLNLFDNHHPEFGVTGGQGIASETPRTFYGQLSYRF